METEQPAEEADRRVIKLNSQQIRTLAHPLRSRLLGALRVDGPATATTLAQALDTNTGATSYHLRQLAEVGLVAEDVDRGTGRQRWWRAVARGQQLAVRRLRRRPGCQRRLGLDPARAAPLARGAGPSGGSPASTTTRPPGARAAGFSDYAA